MLVDALFPVFALPLSTAIYLYAREDEDEVVEEEEEEDKDAGVPT